MSFAIGGTTLTRRRQLEVYYSEKGQILVKNFIRAKTRNQLYLLKSLNKERKPPKDFIIAEPE